MNCPRFINNAWSRTLLMYVVCLVVLLSINACGKNTDKITPTLRDITESVYASVLITPDPEYLSYTARSGVIKEIFVLEGDIVEVGQLLCRISTSNQENKIVDAQISLNEAIENLKGEQNLLKNLRLDLEIQQKQVSLDSINLSRRARLWDQHIGAKVDLDKAKLTLEYSSNRLNNLKKIYIQKSQTLQHLVDKAENQVKSEKILMNDFFIRAELSGRVYRVFKNMGELLNQQEPFAHIGSEVSFKIEMNIDEIDISRIGLMDTLVIRLDAYPEQTHRGYITKILPQKDPVTQTFTAEAAFVNIDRKLYSGLSGEANIIVATRKDVMTIPIAFLAPGNVVLTENGEKTVKVGLKTFDFVEIVSGIEPSVTLIKPTS